MSTAPDGDAAAHEFGDEFGDGAEASRDPASDRRPGERTPDDAESEAPKTWLGWREVWAADRTFPITSHRRFWGGLIVALKRLTGPLVRAPIADLFDRQRLFNLATVDRLDAFEALESRVQLLENRIVDVEGFFKVGIEDLMRYGDGLFTRVDQKLERYRREVREHTAQLRLALTEIESEQRTGEPAGRSATLLERDLEHRYVALEDQHRGTTTEIAARLHPYLELLSRTDGTILDLGCGRGEALEVLRDRGLAAEGVDASEEMVRRCRERGLAAVRGDLLDVLSQREAASLGAVLCFHVIEHLDHQILRRMIDLAFQALAPGGILVLETPSALSLVVASSRFWIDPTHLRPVHPEALRHALAASGFEAIEVLPRSPFPAGQVLPEISLERLDPQTAELADRVNRLRDRLEDLLFGAQDLGVVARKPSEAPPQTKQQHRGGPR